MPNETENTSGRDEEQDLDTETRLLLFSILALMLFRIVSSL